MDSSMTKVDTSKARKESISFVCNGRKECFDQQSCCCILQHMMVKSQLTIESKIINVNNRRKLCIHIYIMKRFIEIS